MPDADEPADDAKPEPVPFPVEVVVNGARVTVTLMWRPGVTVAREREEPEPPKSTTPL